MIRDDSFITVQGWMMNKLNLKGNELLAYAVIYGFSQDEKSVFAGSRRYLASWCNCTVRSIQNTLNSLIEKGLIIAVSKDFGEVVKYKAVIPIPEMDGVGKVFTGGVKKVHGGCENFSHSNIDNTIENIIDNISKDISEPETTEVSISEYEQHMYSEDREKRKRVTVDQPKKLNLYQKCCVMLDEYGRELGFSDAVIDALREYIPLRLAMKDKPIYGVNQWKGMLTKLSKLSGDKEQIVRTAIERGWAAFYAPRQGHREQGQIDKSVFGETDEVQSTKVTKEELENGYLTGEKF